MNDDERDNVIDDVLDWKATEARIERESFDAESYRSELEALSDDELREWWNSTVGYWLASRQDVNERKPAHMSFDDFMDDIFITVQRGITKTKPYGCAI
jgi:hypothetical protein